MMWAALNCPAVTLGQARGAVLLGQPLNLTASIQLEPADAASALCFEADIFYGDTRLDGAQTKVKSEYLAQSPAAVVRIQSSVPVDEPVVTVYLRAGCEQKITRRYVLLADPVPEPVLPALNAQPQLRSAFSVTNVGAAPQAGVERSGAPAPARPVARARERAANSNVPVRANAPVTVKTRVRQGPRLQLLPHELSIEHDPSLKFTDGLLFGATENLQKRAEAAALWRSLNATPQDILKAQGQYKALEADLKGLQAATAKNQQSLQELAARLETAQSQRYFNPLVYALLVVLLLTGAVAVIALRRLRERGAAHTPWWRDAGAPVRAGRDAREPVVDEGVQANQKPVPVRADAGPGAGAGQAAQRPVDIDIDFDPYVSGHAPEPVDVDVDLVAARAGEHIDFAHSMNTSLRAVNTKEMLDVRQQADFFMTLGQHDEAIGMLKDSIEDNDESNPLVYLDLLRVLHALGRRAEFDHYRVAFNALFSGHVPEYAEFNHGGRGLEAYRDVCATISSLWPGQEAVNYIEHCLVRTQGDVESPGFDLEAFRDLLMLHGMARRMESVSDSGLLPFSLKFLRPGRH